MYSWENNIRIRIQLKIYKIIEQVDDFRETLKAHKKEIVYRICQAKVLLRKISILTLETIY